MEWVWINFGIYSNSDYVQNVKGIFYQLALEMISFGVFVARLLHIFIKFLFFIAAFYIRKKKL